MNKNETPKEGNPTMTSDNLFPQSDKAAHQDSRFVSANNRANQGFMMKFANDWTISVRWGHANYSDHRMLKPSDDVDDSLGCATSAECAVWDPDGDWFPLTQYDDVNGHMSTEEVLALMMKTACRGKGERSPEKKNHWDDEDEAESETASVALKASKSELNMEED